MPWNAPRTYLPGELFTASIGNTDIRDNFLETAPAKAQAAGDLFYATGANAIARIAAGSNGHVLTMVTGLPAWAVLPSLIGTIQYFSVTIAAGNASGTATITSVDTTRSVLLYLGYKAQNPGGTATNAFYSPTQVLTNATTVTAQQEGAAQIGISKGLVLEMGVGIVASRQAGLTTITGANTVQNTTVTAVSSKAILYFGGCRQENPGGTANNGNNQASITPTSSTNLQAERETANGVTTTVAWTLIDYP